MVGLSRRVPPVPSDRRPHPNHPAASSAPAQLTATGTINVEQTKLEDELGEFIRLDTNLYAESGSWETLFHTVKGRSNFSAHLHSIPHRARNLLATFAAKGSPCFSHRSRGQHHRRTPPSHAEITLQPIPSPSSSEKK